MFEEITLIKQDIIATIWNGEKQEYYEEAVTQPECFLRNVCRIAEDVTLADVCTLVDRFSELKHILELLVGSIDEIFAAARKSVDGTDLVRLEVYRHVFLSWCGFDYEDERTESAWIAKRRLSADPHYELEMWEGFHGVGVDGKKYAIGLSSVQELASLPISLAAECFVATESKKAGKGRFQQIPARTDFSLQEVLVAIFRELNWYGSEADKAVEGAELLRRLEEARAHPERLIPMEFVDV